MATVTRPTASCKSTTPTRSGPSWEERVPRYGRRPPTTSCWGLRRWLPSGPATSAAAVGVCTTTGKACVTSANCGGGTCFVPPGGCILDLLDMTCVPTNPASCPGSAFCQPILGDPGQGFCRKKLAPRCARNADCQDPTTGGDPSATCNAADQNFNRL